MAGLGGRIGDYLGRKKFLMIALGGFALASAIGGIAQNFAMLAGARALQGVFAAMLTPSTPSMLTVTFRVPKERAKAFAVFGAIAGGGEPHSVWPCSSGASTRPRHTPGPPRTPGAG